MMSQMTCRKAQEFKTKMIEQESKVAPSVPEPAPKKDGVEIPPKLMAWIVNSDMSPEIKAKTVSLILARDSYGFNKYGQHLMSNDGRDSIEDAIQELGDLLQYLFKAKYNGEDISSITLLVPVISALVEGNMSSL